MRHLPGLLFTALSVSAHADLPTDHEYLALHLAIAKVCPELFPQQAKPMRQSAAVLVCDLTEGDSTRVAGFRLFKESSKTQELLASTEEMIKNSSPAEAENVCMPLLSYPHKGQFCTLTDEANFVARVRNGKSVLRQP